MKHYPIAGLLLTAALAVAPSAEAQKLLVPMDAAQTNHLKAYGLTYWVLEQEMTGEWLLNYRAGSFLLPDLPEIRREAALRGVSTQPVDAGTVAAILQEVEASNMERVILEKAPDIAVYTPGNANPWDDAVTLALEYAEIPYEQVWDTEVLQGRLGEYDWLHLHHEDFTGQYSKFYINYAGSAWLQDAVRENEAVAARFGLPDVPALKKAVAEEIRRYVGQGGFLFAMCTATETIELALAAVGTWTSPLRSATERPSTRMRPARWSGSAPWPSATRRSRPTPPLTPSATSMVTR